MVVNSVTNRKMDCVGFNQNDFLDEVTGRFVFAIPNIPASTRETIFVSFSFNCKTN